MLVDFQQATRHYTPEEKTLHNHRCENLKCNTSILLTHRGAGKSLAFPISWFAAQPKEFFLDGLNKLEQRSHKCGAQGGICRVNTFFQSHSLFSL
jgi:hypothetical protein